MTNQTNPAAFPPMRPMSEAPRDGTPILVRFHGGAPEDWHPLLQGGCAVLRFDSEWAAGEVWAFAAPVGCHVSGAVLAGWWPLPGAESEAEPAVLSQTESAPESSVRAAADSARDLLRSVVGKPVGLLSVGKHTARHPAHLRAVYQRALETDQEFADTLMWLLWWRCVDANQAVHLIESPQAAPEAAPRLRVKPLVWEVFKDNPDLWGAWDGLEKFHHVQRDGAEWIAGKSGEHHKGRHPTREAAQAAAEAHHDAAVRELVGKLCDLG